MSSASGNSTANATHYPRGDSRGALPVGRFAPSPSGPLHFGSLTSALASFLDVRARSGRWLLRIDDLDSPRTVSGSESAILRSLEAHGLCWDDEPVRQSDTLPQYLQTLGTLAERGCLFFCNCSRKSLRGTPVYPGTCRANTCNAADIEALAGNPTPGDHAIRLRVPDVEICFADELLGEQRCDLATESGDYVVYRRDGLVSYQLAVVVDDILAGVNRVVRGADLLPTTARQQHLHGALDSNPPDWLHLPVLLNSRGTKLSKQAHSLPIDDSLASQSLITALQLLGQNPPDSALGTPPAEIVDWATQHWKPQNIPAQPNFQHFYAW